MAVIYDNKQVHKGVIAYVFLWALLFIFTLRAFSVANFISQSRILFIVAIITMGYFVGKKNVRPVKTIRYAIAIAAYMTFVCLIYKGINADAISQMISNLLWVIVIYQLYKMEISEKDMQLISYIMVGTCNLCAFIYVSDYIIWITELENIQAIGAINSIYYILSLIPFVFFIKEIWLSVLLYLLPLYAITVSGKTTCLFCAIMIIVYIVWSSFKTKGGMRVAILLASLGLLAFRFLSTLDINVISTAISEDLETGGNGRQDIWLQVLALWIDGGLFQLIFGHGVNAISLKIGLGGHNDFLEMLYCYGIVGLLLLVSFIISLYKVLKISVSEISLKTAYVISLIVFLFSITASKLFATQIGMIPLSLFWGIYFSYIFRHKCSLQ